MIYKLTCILPDRSTGFGRSGRLGSLLPSLGAGVVEAPDCDADTAGFLRNQCAEGSTSTSDSGVLDVVVDAFCTWVMQEVRCC